MSGHHAQQANAAAVAAAAAAAVAAASNNVQHQHQQQAAAQGLAMHPSSPTGAQVQPQAGNASSPAMTANGISSGSSGAVGAQPVASKAREEIVTSLHLIKDIRRLETYQRDFFLKVIYSNSSLKPSCSNHSAFLS